MPCSWLFSKMLKDFHDFCLFNTTDQLAVGIVFCCFWLKNYENRVLRYSMTIKQYLCVEESLKKQKMVSMLSNGVCMTVSYHNKFVKLIDKLCFQVFFGPVYANYGVWGQASIENVWDRSVGLKNKEHGAISAKTLTLVALCLNLKYELMCLTAFLFLNAK